MGDWYNVQFKITFPPPSRASQELEVSRPKAFWSSSDNDDDENNWNEKNQHIAKEARYQDTIFFSFPDPSPGPLAGQG